MAGQRLDLDQRGVNWHQHSIAVFKGGALHLSKEALRRVETGDIEGNAFKKGPKVAEDDFKMRAQKK